MGPVSVGIFVLSAGALYSTRKSKDRTVRLLAVFIVGSAMASLLVHYLARGVSTRSSSMMMLDAVGLYAMGLLAVCRMDRPVWLYALTCATTLECAAHIAYVSGAISGNAHTFALNLLFICQIASLWIGRSAQPEEDLREPLDGEVMPSHPLHTLTPFAAT